MKKLIGLIGGLLLAISSFAQDSAGIEKTLMDNPLFTYYIVLALIFVLIALATLVAFYLFRVLNILNEKFEEKALKSGVSYTKSPGWWERFTQSMNASVPVEEEKTIELEHSYDGIKELDNHLPPWWKWLFYGTIVWAVIYVIVFHFSNNLPLSIEEYQIEVAVAEEHAKQRNASQPAIDENSLTFSNDPAIIENGKNVFNNNPCGSCHRPDGGGNTIGPNLTDKYWLHGGDVKNVFNTIKNGVVEKGMPAWEKAMSPKDLRDVTYYIISLQGTNPPDAKAPQGELFKESIPVKADSTNAQAKL